MSSVSQCKPMCLYVSCIIITKHLWLKCNIMPPAKEMTNLIKLWFAFRHECCKWKIILNTWCWSVGAGQYKDLFLFETIQKVSVMGKLLIIVCVAACLIKGEIYYLIFPFVLCSRQYSVKQTAFIHILSFYPLITWGYKEVNNYYLVGQDKLFRPRNLFMVYKFYWEILKKEVGQVSNSPGKFEEQWGVWGACWYLFPLSPFSDWGSRDHESVQFSRIFYCLCSMWAQSFCSIFYWKIGAHICLKQNKWSLPYK